MEIQTVSKKSPFDEIKQEIIDELDEAKRSLKEVRLMLEQSQIEVNKLTTRNTSITSHLQLIKSQEKTTSPSEIQTTYTAALDAQQRLLLMRGQLVKLQTEQTNLERHINMLEKILAYFSQEETTVAGSGAMKRGDEILEKIINSQEIVRQRLSRQMHDGPAQALSNFILQTEIANRMFDIDNAKAKDELNALYNTAMNTFQQVRSYIFELRPMILDDLGLFPTLHRYVDTLKEQAAADVNLSINGQEKRLEPFLEVVIFRAVQEIVINAIQYNSESTNKIQVNVQINLEGSIIRVIVSDNGKGFDPETIDEGHGFGLKLIRERVEMLGGEMNISSTPGQGSTISFQVPCLEYEDPSLNK